MQITKKTNKKKAIGTESYKSFRNMQHSLFTASPRFSGPPVTFSTLLFQCSLYHWPLHLLLHLSFCPSQRSHSFSFSSQLPSCLALFKPCWDNIENYLVLKILHVSRVQLRRTCKQSHLLYISHILWSETGRGGEGDWVEMSNGPGEKLIKECCPSAEPPPQAWSV